MLIGGEIQTAKFAMSLSKITSLTHSKITLKAGINLHF